MQQSRTILRYSLAFKQKVVSEVESGKLSILEAHRVYDIRGCGTVAGWIRKMGKNHLLNKVVRIEMRDEKDRIKELEKEKRVLESALAQEHLKNMTLEALIEIAGDAYKVDLKKTFGDKAFRKS